MNAVEIDAIHITKTYAGCLEGRPSSSSIIESAIDDVSDLFGARATYVIPPKTPPIDILPTWQYIVWLNSYVPVKNKEADGSWLVVIYWADELEQPDVKKLMPKIDWGLWARDWWI